MSHSPAGLYPVAYDHKEDHRRSLLLLAVIGGRLRWLPTTAAPTLPPRRPATSRPFSSDLADAEVYPVFISSEIVVGENRFLVGLLDDNDAPIGDPNVKVDIAFYDFEESKEEPAFEEPAEFIWIDEDAGRGVWVAYPEFSHAGDWGAEVFITGSGYDEAIKGSFEVAETGTTPAHRGSGTTVRHTDHRRREEARGDHDRRAPGPELLSSCRSRRRSRPASRSSSSSQRPSSARRRCAAPPWTTSRKWPKDFPKITFIHSEIYENLDPTQPPVPAVQEWGLPGEPWVFVVDANGNVAAKFEGSASQDELTRGPREALVVRDRPRPKVSSARRVRLRRISRTSPSVRPLPSTSFHHGGVRAPERSSRSRPHR